MNIDLIVVGKTDREQISTLTEEYIRRVGFHTRTSLVTLPDVKSSRKLSPESQKRMEGEAILRQLAPGDHVVLLDENGTEYTSVEFASWLQKRMNGGVRRLCFVIGGPYGFSPEVYRRADDKVSLSRMTFSHQIIRAIFAEQLYRAFTILRNEPYHHA
ncbi:MAG: 23S rRNA (pseudouridine(1915)-N(3))-methyltransferase RlmH [Rikenellaceae bacterium]|nr:23S rRNA (pseudouridine(1915)-N(3))-methyltransferase RlmH [Rikenellaceae bacterium]